jgi:hypothetical protein
MLNKWQECCGADFFITDCVRQSIECHMSCFLINNIASSIQTNPIWSLVRDPMWVLNAN